VVGAGRRMGVGGCGRFVCVWGGGYSGSK